MVLGQIKELNSPRGIKAQIPKPVVDFSAPLTGYILCSKGFCDFRDSLVLPAHHNCAPVKCWGFQDFLRKCRNFKLCETCLDLNPKRLRRRSQRLDGSYGSVRTIRPHGIKPCNFSEPCGLWIFQKIIRQRTRPCPPLFAQVRALYWIGLFSMTKEDDLSWEGETGNRKENEKAKNKRFHGMGGYQRSP